MIYDLDHGFDWEWGVSGFSESTNMFKWVKQGGRGDSDAKCHTNSTKDFTGDKAHCFHVLYTKLIENANFKRLFLNHAAVMLDSYLNAKNVREKVKFLAGMLNSEDVARDMEIEAYKERRSQYAHSFDPYGERLGPWADERDGEFLSQIQSEFGLSGTSSVTISANGSGSILVDGMTLPNTSYKAKFFTGNGMVLTAVPQAGAVFGGWTGCEAVPDVPTMCVATVTDGLSITATFK